MGRKPPGRRSPTSGCSCWESQVPAVVGVGRLMDTTLPIYERISGFLTSVSIGASIAVSFEWDAGTALAGGLSVGFFAEMLHSTNAIRPSEGAGGQLPKWN